MKMLQRGVFQDLVRHAIVNEGVCHVMVTIVGNGHGDVSSNPWLDCISHSANNLGKSINLIILPSAKGK